MHRTALLFAAIVFILVTVASYFAASTAVTYIETETRERISVALVAAGQDWATISPDGLRVDLTGLAPDEASRLRALEVIGQIVDAGRTTDKTTVLQSREIAPPRFSLEILRNVDRISLIGLVPEETGRNFILDMVSSLDENAQVTDMLESADHPVPEGWNRALHFGLESLTKLPRSKVSVTPERVKITAVSETPAEQQSLEQALASARPDSLKLELDISAPRPVISPFRFRLTIEDNEVTLVSCSADTAQTRTKIIQAVIAAGLTDKAQCEIGLGVPTTDWAPAVVQAVQSLSALGGGSVTFTDSDIALIAQPDTAQETYDSVVANLENKLPELFSLHALLTPKPLVGSDGTKQEQPDFIATRSPEGLVLLRGRLPNQLSKKSVGSYANALFGRENVYNQTRIDAELPDGWPLRVLAGLEGLAQLHHGSLYIEPQKLALKGTGAQADVESEISRILSVRLGGKENYDIAVAFDEKLVKSDQPLTSEQCERQITAVLTSQQIVFSPSSTDIEPSSQGVVDAISEILRDCSDTKFEIQGHTDSQGREELNQNLSQARAEAVLSAILARKVLTSGLTAKGYGEAEPIADNKTEEGRAQNRRITFKLIPENTNE